MDCRIARLSLDAGKSHSIQLHRTFFLDAGKSQLTSNRVFCQFYLYSFTCSITCSLLPIFVSFANCINVLDVISFHS